MNLLYIISILGWIFVILQLFVIRNLNKYRIECKMTNIDFKLPKDYFDNPIYNSELEN